MAQFIKITSDYFEFRFHCPACGAMITDDDGEDASNPCEHWLFRHNSEAGLLYVAEEVQTLFDDLENNDEGEGWELDDPEVLERLPDNAVLFALSDYPGVPGARITNTYGIQFPVVEE